MLILPEPWALSQRKIQIVITIVKALPSDEEPVEPACNYDLISEIRELADRQGVLILAHNYQAPEIYQIAEKIGDSLELARLAQETDAETILFCGVDFMADTAKILNPQARVLIPDPQARCTMAHMAGEQAAIDLREQYPDAEVVSYVNTTTATKAVSDICCTSANAIEIVDSVDSEQVIFLPDRNLAAYVSRFTRKEIIPAAGYCYVHDAITRESVDAMQKLHPGAVFVAHPECRPEIIDMADAVCSTGGMARFCRDASVSSFIIGTESGMLHRLRSEVAEKKFFSVAGICAPMKQITLEKIKACLTTGSGEVVLDKSLMDAARVPLERMIEVSKTRQSRSFRTREEIRKGL
ncbi:quinolinate synthase NadA [Methanospirillum lacunae]|uniref:Quinolinate synthase n=1 Tax=Methanospirillum lacunae TaxID=668570 RepID=A0A2V2N380_9EURY|nr:quinolinate synthase NadA [Methanospirillum lacunae]PWR70988.1 quinolinate synthase [Methanospirillum lacunae]